MTIKKENILKDYVLLVEGKSDKEFFETLFRNKENELLGDKKIPMFILVPDELNPDSGNNKTNLIKELIVQINSFKDANLKRLGVIVDADFKNINNGGVEKTMKTISDALLKKDKLQASLFEYAIDCFSKIPDKQAIQHRDIDKSKSEIATWLAFQKKPQYSLAAVVNLIDFTQHTAKNLMDWLKDTFPKTENL